MRRQRSVSFYADSQEEFIEEYNKRKSISERRRCRSNSYTDKNSKNDDKSKNNEILRKKKIFQSYDDLELEQLGVNSTYQITKMEKEDIQVNEDIGIIKKLYNINLSFKQNNNNSFFSNLTPLTKNIIGKFGRKNSKKNNKLYQRYRTQTNVESNIFNDKNEKNNGEENAVNEEEEDNEFLLGIGHRSCQMRYNGLKNIEEDSNEPKRKRINSIIENNNSQNEECSFLDNININELQNFEKYQRNESDLERNESSDIIIDNDDNANNDELEIKKENSNETSGEEFEIKRENSFGNNNKLEDKKNRKFTFDIKTFIPNPSDNKEAGNETINQFKTLQNYISNNEFLSKNIDYVDEHLKFLITGSDINSKHLFISQLLNSNVKNEDINLEGINIIKKIIKLLGDYIKLELYEENCNLCYSHMLQTYTDISDGIIFIINMKDENSAKYIYDIIGKLKYKISKDKRYFNTILLCFYIKNNSNSNEANLTDKDNIIINNNVNSIVKNIYKDFDIKPNYITFDLNNGEYQKNYKNEKFELVINKFLSLAYLKKERKRKPKYSKKTHKRGITGL